MFTQDSWKIKVIKGDCGDWLYKEQKAVKVSFLWNVNYHNSKHLRYLLEVEMMTASVLKQAFLVHAELTYCGFLFLLIFQLQATSLNFFLIRPKFMYSILTFYRITIL